MESGYTNAKPLSLAPEHVAGAVAEAVPDAHDAKVTTMCTEVGAAGRWPLLIVHSSMTLVAYLGHKNIQSTVRYTEPTAMLRSIHEVCNRAACTSKL